jgi:hypothetical protein
MANFYRLTGAQDPASRIDRVLVEDASDEYPDGKTLELDGPAVELSADQYSKLANFVRLQPSENDDVEVQYVDQPGVHLQSMSTNVPPDPGTAPDVDSLSKEQLVQELARVRAQDPQAAEDVSEKSNKEDLAKALRRYHGQEG